MTRALLILGLVGVVFLSAQGQQTPPQAAADATATKLAKDRLAQEVARVQLVGVNGLNCPIMATAQRGGSGALVQTRKGEPAQPRNELKLHFSATAQSGITEATISLHGTDSRPRAELAYSLNPSAPELTEVVHLTRSTDRALTTASVSPKQVVNVRWVGITELKFVDGTTWHSSQNSYCRVQPNGFRLVDATAH